MVVRLKRFDYVCIMVLSATALADMLTSTADYADERPAARAAAYFASAHLAIATKWIVTQVRVALSRGARTHALLGCPSGQRRVRAGAEALFAARGAARAQVPARMVVFPELLRNIICVALAVAFVRATDAPACTPAVVAGLLARGAATTVAVPCVVNLCHNPLFKEARVSRCCARHPPAR